MTDELKKIIKDEIGVLPKETQDAIASVDWVKISEEIGKKYLLNDDEINDLQVEMLVVLVGLEDPELFVGNIENEVGTTRNEAENIARELNEKIFAQIKKVLIENIKNGMKDKRVDWRQSLDFILSGGNYAAFMDTPGAEEGKRN